MHGIRRMVARPHLAARGAQCGENAAIPFRMGRKTRPERGLIDEQFGQFAVQFVDRAGRIESETSGGGLGAVAETGPDFLFFVFRAAKKMLARGFARDENEHGFRFEKTAEI